ncbi:MAG: hypothetical protein M1835_007099 [Candelina submexicana]|nr:MAG: hypothetical protein M1835_007099 [Candelina submexicana]
MPGAWSSCASTDDEPELDDSDDTQSESEASYFQLTSLALYSEATPSDKDKADDMEYEKDETKGSVEITFDDDISGLLAMRTMPNSYVGPVTASREPKEKEPNKAITLAEQVEDVREALGVPVIPYKDSDIRAHHPKHPYNFYNKNLRCVKCDGNCQICQASCCKYKYFEVRAKDTTILRSASDEIDPVKALNRIIFWQPTENSYVQDAVGSARIGWSARIYNASNASQNLGSFATGTLIFD